MDVQIQRDDSAEEDSVMTFEEIGLRLGIGCQAARGFYVRGIRKLRKMGLDHLIESAQQRQALAAKRQRVYPTIEA